MSAIRIITTGDGSHSLFNEQLNETYHSVHGAIQESTHVFIKSGLDFVLTHSTKKQINILEVGFGTGLNALLSLQQVAGRDVLIRYTSLEAFPIDASVWSRLNYAETEEDKLSFKKLHESKWNEWETVTSNFKLEKLNNALENAVFEANHFDLIYFDAFAPNKQPELWKFDMLKKVVDAMNHNGVFVTYCAKGQLKRDLKSLGLYVESLPGPPGKREMVRAMLNLG